MDRETKKSILRLFAILSVLAALDALYYAATGKMFFSGATFNQAGAKTEPAESPKSP